MASTMALRQLTYKRPVAGGGEPIVLGGPEYPNIKETATQSYKVSDLVYHDSSGTIAICAQSSGTLNSEIAGQAMKAATGVTGAQAFLRPIRAVDRFIANLYHSTAATAITAQTIIGERFNLIRVNGLWHIDFENTTVEDGTTAKATVQVINFEREGFNSDGRTVEQDLVNFGDIYGLCEIMFLPLTMETTGDQAIRRNLQYDLA